MIGLRSQLVMFRCQTLSVKLPGGSLKGRVVISFSFISLTDTSQIRVDLRSLDQGTK